MGKETDAGDITRGEKNEQNLVMDGMWDESKKRKNDTKVSTWMARSLNILEFQFSHL